MPVMQFDKIHISDERYESACAFDVNNDGVIDIVSGAYWYPGPDFKKKCKIGPVRAEGEYYDDFSTIPMDVNGDGYVDIITGGWWGNTLRWRENPKGDPTKEWKEHIIAEVGNIETTRAWDIDGDGELEIVPNTPNGPVRAYKLDKAAGKFTEHVLYKEKSGHGFGFGDIDGCGKGEIILAKGFLKAPSDPLSGEWTYHEEWDLGFWAASCPMLVVDVNKDGLADVIVGNAHGFGLYWLEQKLVNGKRTWKKHDIDPYSSQYHDMHWVDIDGDGECELVTGKRYRAHCGKDPGEYEPYGTYYFKWTGETFVKNVIDYGHIRQGKGIGIHSQVIDINGDGKLDILAPGKDGLCLFVNRGFQENMGD
jgi:hypothetical protein